MLKESMQTLHAVILIAPPQGFKKTEAVLSFILPLDCSVLMVQQHLYVIGDFHEAFFMDYII